MGKYDLIHESIEGQNLMLFVLSGRIHLHNFSYVTRESSLLQTTPSFQELIFVSDGYMCVKADGKVFDLDAGDILFIPEGTERSFISTGLDFDAFLFDYNYYRHTSEEIRRTPHLTLLQECINDELFIINNLDRQGLSKVKDDGSCQREIDNLMNCLQRHYTGDYIRMQATLAGLFVVMLQNFTTRKVADSFPDVALATMGRHANMAIRISEYIQANCAEKITVESVAKAMNYSSRHVQRIVQEYFGFNVSRLINQHRVALVKKLLNGPALSLQEIAYRSGYSDTRTMDRQFREVSGITISQYMQTQKQ